MKKTLVNVIHPTLEETSIVNKRWAEELAKYPDKFLVRHLYQIYADERINIEVEQKLVEEYDKIVFQFPVRWLSGPPLLKKWLDDVLTYGWAYGPGSHFKLAGKKIVLALTASADHKTYSREGAFRYTLEEFTTPFQITFEWIKADYKPLFAFYGAPHGHDEQSLLRVEQSAGEYISYLDSIE